VPAHTSSTVSLTRTAFKTSGRLLLLTAVAALALSACAGKPKERTRLVYEERPVESLYNAGMKRLDQKSWNEAVDYFEEVERQHPYSEWSRRSIVMEIYAHYQANDYNEATAASERFIKLYPGSPLTPYAYYMRAISYFEQIVDVGRDQAYTETAQSYLREIVQRYPGTEYARDAQVKLDMVSDQLAGKEMEIGRFYLQSNQPLAAIGRFKTVVTKYQTTSHAPEALYRLVEANLMMGILDEAGRNAAVLGYNYPGDRWYSEAYKLMKERGQPLDIKPQPVSDKKTKKEQKEKKSWLSRINPM